MEQENKTLNDIPESSDPFHAVVTSNSSSHPYAGVVACTMFFAQGEMAEGLVMKCSIRHSGKI